MLCLRKISSESLQRGYDKRIRSCRIHHRELEKLAAVDGYLMRFEHGYFHNTLSGRSSSIRRKFIGAVVQYDFDDRQ
uniref:Uncharacterized protein n=1 Tax=Candidatus Methanogaster sp. ANME-2c ERB4 TaxID=2759911 RepID=A0A7G9Y8P7_9EURY|nr:hypothetical protein MNAPFPCD_00002 [Methanosarcinales archaeon ANME-2c ERB4]